LYAECDWNQGAQPEHLITNVSGRGKRGDYLVSNANSVQLGGRAADDMDASALHLSVLVLTAQQQKKVSIE
jgi:hypothetical protein